MRLPHRIVTPPVHRLFDVACGTRSDRTLAIACRPKSWLARRCSCRNHSSC